MPGSFRFDRFHLDLDDRQLRSGESPVELNSRYFDALALLVSEQGRLVSKDRFLDEVWRGVPVTDEALTQCIRTLRRQLGDDAGRPRFIETVPKHGYRFVAPVETREATTPKRVAPALSRGWTNVATLAAAGSAGGALAGVGGGLLDGLGASPDPLHPSVGATSFLMVMVAVNNHWNPGFSTRPPFCRATAAANDWNAPSTTVR